MTVSLPDIAALSREVVSQHDGGLDVVAVTTTGGDSDRVEVTVDIGGCDIEPCRFVVNVTRSDKEQFDRDFRMKLTEALAKHAADPR
jgi:hypothetical protein